MSYLSDDKHTIGLATFVLGLLFVVIGVVLFLVKDRDKEGVSRWRKTSSILVLALGSFGVLVGIALMSCSVQQTAPPAIPLVDFETLRSDLLELTSREQEPAPAVLLPEYEVLVHPTDITLTVAAETQLKIGLPGSLFQKGYIFKSASMYKNSLFTHVGGKLADSKNQILRFVIKPKENLAILRERISVKNTHVTSFNLQENGQHLELELFPIEENTTDEKLSWRLKM